jgi:hypothetical protein
MGAVPSGTSGGAADAGLDWIAPVNLMTCGIDAVDMTGLWFDGYSCDPSTQGTSLGGFRSDGNVLGCKLLWCGDRREAPPVGTWRFGLRPEGN